MLKRLQATFVILLLVCKADYLAAQTPGDSDSAISVGTVETLPLIKKGRSGRISELDRLKPVNPTTDTPVQGEINPLRLPPGLGQSTSGLQTGTQAPEFTVMANAPTASLSIPGYSNNDNAVVTGGILTPPDTNGDVGLTHYVQYVNVGWVFYDKATGAVAGGPFAGNTFWTGFGGACETFNAGDPVVLYDHLAGRWFFSQFTGTNAPDGGHQCIAISDGEDPAGPYTLFDFLVSPGGFNDYPKIGLWPDGYYMTTHEFAGNPLTFQGVNLIVFDRAALLTGNAGGVLFSPTTLPFGSLAANLEGPDLPPAGSCNYLVHATDATAFGLAGPDRYQFWEACVDFATPTNSSLTQLPDVVSPTFDVNLCGFSRDCIEQPSTQRLDPVAGFTIYRFNNRYFPAEGLLRSAVTNNVDVGGDRAGVMWAGFEINPVTDAVAIGDGGDLLGVIDFNDGLSRWMGSASVDAAGNIGIGYTRSSATSFPSIYFTVHERGVDAPGGVQAESVCIDGTGTHEGANRWADYASTSVDPVDNCTFWHTNEYVETTGNFSWNTRICSFTIPSCLAGFTDISLVQTVPATIDEPGGDVSVNIIVSNASGVAAELTGLLHNLAGDLNGQGTCSVPQALAAGGAYNCSFSLDASGNAGDVITSVTTATGTQNSAPFSENDSDDIAVQDVLPMATVTKTANPLTISEPAEDVTFSVEISNQSAAESLTLAILTDDIHGFLNGQGTCSLPQTIAVSGNYSCSFTVNVTGNAGDIETDTITAVLQDDDGNTIAPTGSATVTITDVLPTIVVAKTAAPTAVDEPGGNVTFSTQVQNTGMEVVTLSSLVDDIHGDLNGQGTCSVPQTIAAAGTYSCSFTATVNGNAGDIETDTITAMVSDDDGNTVQGQASATVTITDRVPAINVSKVATPQTVEEPGGDVTFSTQVQNTGMEAVTLTSLIDDVHGDLNGQGTCSVPQTIAVDGTYSCSIMIVVNGNAGDTETDTITAVVSDDDGNTVQGQASATVTIIDVVPTVAVVKTATPNTVDEPGGDVTFSTQVQNTSMEALTLSSLMDDIHGDLNGQGMCAVPQTIAANSSYSCSFTATVNGNAGDSETDTITAVVFDDDGNTVQGQASATVTITDRVPAININKVATPQAVDEPGGDVTFSTQIQNTAAESITLNSLVDDIHGDLNGQGTCSVPQTIAADGTYSCSFTAAVNGNAGDSETDTITAMVSDNDGNTVQGQASATVTISDVLPTIMVVKTATPSSVDEPGANVTFSAQVQNTAVEEVILTSLVDDIHGNLNGQGTCSVPQNIAAGGSYDCSFTVMVTGVGGQSETDIIIAAAVDDELNSTQAQDSATVVINNVATAITAPATINGLEDSVLLLETVAVVDPGAPLVFVSLGVSNGLLTLNGTTGLSFDTGDGVDDTSMSFNGSVAAVNQALNAAGYQPNPNFNGVDVLQVAANDSASQRLASTTVDLLINAVNDAPSFIVGPNQTAENDAGAQSIDPWATAISAGPVDEAGQSVSFEVTANSNPGLFAVQPVVAADGSLSFTPQVGMTGVASVSLRITDDGGTDNEGDNQSDEQAFTITIEQGVSADLSIMKGNGTGGAIPGTVIDYTIIVSNAGPDNVTGATVVDTIPANLINANWVCAADAGASCTASGTGNINDTVNLPADASVTYTLSVTVNASDGDEISNTASVTAPSAVPDLNPGNNTSTDSDPVGLFADGFEDEF